MINTAENSYWKGNIMTGISKLALSLAFLNAVYATGVAAEQPQPEPRYVDPPQITNDFSPSVPVTFCFNDGQHIDGSVTLMTETATIDRKLIATTENHLPWDDQPYKTQIELSKQLFAQINKVFQGDAYRENGLNIVRINRPLVEPQDTDQLYQLADQLNVDVRPIVRRNAVEQEWDVYSSFVIPFGSKDSGSACTTPSP